ncbi:MAG TPA: Uma2 family endonuclease [Pirellulales bacterium]|jgi:Uma2 family endonuclease|nr:Uma2 family endonuclease [Pirellulales bacterium]
MSTTRSQLSDHVDPTLRVVPPLENGDCLSRDEFERRYEAMPEVHQAELIDGVVYMPSPIYLPHADSHAAIVTWLGMYAAQTPGVQCLACGSIRIDDKNEVQPDAYLRLLTGGKSTTDAEKYVVGAPELVAEVASSSVSRDMHQKLRLYERIGVREYLVWRVLDREIDWYQLEAGRFQPLVSGDDGIVRSRVFPGLWLDRAAMPRWQCGHRAGAFG